MSAAAQIPNRTACDVMTVRSRFDGSSLESSILAGSRKVLQRTKVVIASE
jgi:hypothetical protein